MSSSETPSPPMLQRRPLCIVPDTNQWRSSLALMSPIGSALRYYVNFSGAKIGLPEVIESELSKHVLKRGTDAVAAIKSGLLDLKAIMGTHSAFTLPTSEEISGAVAARLTDIDNLIVRVPLTLEQTRSALDRVNAGTPPNTPQKQQFKDSLIWEGLLELGKDFVIHFVTEDGDFRAQGSNGELAPSLKQECEERGIELYLYAKIADCLESIRNEIPDLNYLKIADIVHESVRPRLMDYVAQHGLRLEALTRWSVRAFATERHDVLAVDFELDFTCDDSRSDSEQPRTNMMAFVSGSCSLPVGGGLPLELRLGSIDYEWVEATGLQQRFGMVFGRAHGFFGGEPPVKHTVKYEIPRRQSATGQTNVSASTKVDS